MRSQKTGHDSLTEQTNKQKLDNEDGADMNTMSDIRKDLRALKVSKVVLKVLVKNEIS